MLMASSGFCDSCHFNEDPGRLTLTKVSSSTICFMKSLLFIICCFMLPFVFTDVNAALPCNLDSVIAPAFLNNIKLSAVIHLPASAFYKVSGRKPSFKEKLAFPLLKMDMKKAVARDRNVTVGQYLTAHKKLTAGQSMLIILGALIVILLIIALSSPMIHLPPIVG